MSESSQREPLPLPHDQEARNLKAVDPEEVADRVGIEAWKCRRIMIAYQQEVSVNCAGWHFTHGKPLAR